MKYFLICLVLLLGVAYITNPDEDDHEEKIEEVLNKTVDSMSSEMSIKFGNFVGLELLKSLATQEGAAAMIESKNYLFFSLTQVKISESTRLTIGIGAFGGVKTFVNFI